MRWETAARRYGGMRGLDPFETTQLNNPVFGLNAQAANMLNLKWRMDAQTNAFTQYVSGLTNYPTPPKWRSINPKKQMTEREARLLIVGGLRP